MMDAIQVARDLGGGAVGVMVVGLGFAVSMLWRRVTMLQDKLFDTQQTASKELRDMQAAFQTALSANNTALTAATAAMTAAVAEQRGRG